MKRAKSYLPQNLQPTHEQRKAYGYAARRTHYARPRPQVAPESVAPEVTLTSQANQAQPA